MRLRELIADRFVVIDDGRTFDLATGVGIALVSSSAGGHVEQLRWVARCDRFHRLRHRSFARLVDYGALGEMRRFEAWESTSWEGSSIHADETLVRARSFLAASGLTVAGLDGRSVRGAGGRPVVLPDQACGLDCQEIEPAAIAPLQDVAVCGLAVVARQEVAALAELFADAASTPRAVALWGREGSGLRTAAAELARAARAHGLVPIRSTILNEEILEFVGGRSLLVIGDEPVDVLWTRTLDLLQRDARGHVTLFVGESEVRGVAGVGLRPIAPSVLVESLRPRSVAERIKARVRRAAERADGLPGRFAAALWGVERPSAMVIELAPVKEGSGPRRAAETVPEYGVAVVEPGAPRPSERSVDRRWPVPGELSALRKQLDGAIAALEAGRAAAGERAARQAVGALARRHDWTNAARGTLALARAFLRRGRPNDARGVLRHAREYVARAGEPSGSDDLAGRVSILAGEAAIELARLGEAEAILRTLVAARATGDVADQARLALARCLFWHGAFSEAKQALAGVDATGPHEQTLVRRSALAARIAVGLGRLSEAVGGALGALETAKAAQSPRLLADAACAAAFAHLAVGDRASLDRDVAVCTAAARRARDPLRAMKARLLAAEGARRAGHRGPARALIARLERVSRGQWPPLLQARLALLGELLSSDDDTGAIRRAVAATGLEALALFTPASLRVEAGGLPGHVADAIDILRCCQSPDDERAVLSTVCDRLKDRLGASGVAFFGVSSRGAGGPETAPLATVGRVDASIAERVAFAGLTIAPHQVEERIEGGAPVRYGGQTVGLVAARWALGASCDSARASALLAIAATVAGPAVAAVSAERRRGDVAVDDEIAGVSLAIADLRRAVDRSAAAPFAVMIRGESGSGKELVARALHRRGPRRSGPFTTLNCAALPDDLVESELFGHARGAFTGAVTERVGVFEAADGGTLFLDEVGELSPRAQAKVLRAIQECEVRRIGENVPRRVDVRIVSATNRDLQREAAEGRFRLDLFYRLDVIHIAVPPLRERRDDIPVLAERLWRDAAGRMGATSRLSASTLAALARYDWPGNVRELQNVLAGLAVRGPKRGLVPPTALPAAFGAFQPDRSWRLAAARRLFEEQFVRAALARCGGQRTRAAGELGLTRQGLMKLMIRLGIAER